MGQIVRFLAVRVSAELTIGDVIFCAHTMLDRALHKWQCQQI